ncbi:MAG: hypothetical protein IBX55_07355 [Methyloprofundus sp.]|nr:hypothetical protein [Methyloprofundus sp.]MBW6453173.1 hypothetical protein [Methyloprofundus sp.]
MKLLKVIVIILVANLLACTQPKVVNKACLFASQKKAPNWICDEPYSDLAIQAVGKFELSFGGRNYMLDMAEIAARKQLIERFKLKVARKISLYAEKSELSSKVIDALIVSANKHIDNESLADAKVYQIETGPENEVYVLLGLDHAKTKVLIEEVLVTSMQNEKNLWQVFKTQNVEPQLAAAIAAIKD